MSTYLLTWSTNRLPRSWKTEAADKVDRVDPNDEGFFALEGEQRLALLLHRKREGMLRKRKIQQVLKVKGCLECEVPACGFDFLKVYGEIGRNFAHVHHVSPLGDRRAPSLTRLSELAVVCPNCHAMIHRGGENRPLPGLVKT